MKTKFKFVFSVLFAVITSAQPVLAEQSKYQDNTFKPAGKSVYSIWPVIPFFPLGDIGQYQKTMSQDRDQVRKMFWSELTSELNELADKGVAVESMVEALAKILMMFDQVHDIHKAKDVINIDKSLEAQFKARLDNLFSTFDVRDGQRKIQISGGTNENLMQAYLRGITSNIPLGHKISKAEVDVKASLEMFEQIDYVAYGTFSSLGEGQFQLTFHLSGNKNGVTRSFIAKGTLTEALDKLAKQVFDFFQKNVYPDWETPHTLLSWLPIPINPNKVEGYTWEESNAYCKLRGYRLPFARELLMAESGGQYKEGGIANLDYTVSYPVANKRLANINYVFTAGHEAATGGPVQGASYTMKKGQFWCVKGQASDGVLAFENVWALIRKYQTDDEVFRALATVRYEIGDFGSDQPIFKGPDVKMLERMESLEVALKYLKSRGIKLSIPASLK